MSDADRDAQQIDAIAAMTAAEVRAGLRQFGLRPIKYVPPELNCLNSAGQRRSGEITQVIGVLEENQDSMPTAPDGDTRLRNLKDRAAMRRHFQWPKNPWVTSAFRNAAAVLILALLVAVYITLEVRAGYDSVDEKILDEVSTINFTPVDGTILGGVSIINFTPDEERHIREAIAPLYSSQCTEAFKHAALRSPAEVATSKGVVIRPSTDLYIYSAEDLGLVHEQVRRAYWEGFSSERAQAGSVPALRKGVQLTTDGRSRIFIHKSAFIGRSFLLGTFSLNDVLMHEFIHVGGQPATPGFLGPLQHDLAGFDHYDEIMESCK